MKPRARIEIVPMIDVMMFLLVFFVLISINVIPAFGIKTKLPGSAQPQELKSLRNVIVTMGIGGELLLDGGATTLEELPQRIKALARPDQRVAVIINGDKGVDIQRLVNVIDRLKESGIDGFALAAQRRGG